MGIILITMNYPCLLYTSTKSGKGGSGLGISFSQTFGIDHAYKTPDIQTVYGDGPYVIILF